jgi:protein-tyrosine phosphatase
MHETTYTYHKLKPNNQKYPMLDHTYASKSLLFLCTGNYYRSRFAEILFNALIAQTSLRWIASSRGIATERGIRNIGPLSEHARLGLNARGIELPHPLPFPQQLKREDLESADHIIALKEAEHRPLLDERFPSCGTHIEFWHVHDLDQAPANIALSAIEREVRHLLMRLTTDASS